VDATELHLHEQRDIDDPNRKWPRVEEANMVDKLTSAIGVWSEMFCGKGEEDSLLFGSPGKRGFGTR